MPKMVKYAHLGTLYLLTLTIGAIMLTVVYLTYKHKYTQTRNNAGA